MKKLIVIPARGGSKGIYRKNIYPLNGRPLIHYTLELIKTANLLDTDVAVSTDSHDIKMVAGQYDHVYVIDRPSEISGDKAKTEDALLHAIDYLQSRYGKEYDAVVTLQATSPFRKPETLHRFIKTFENKYPTIDALLSLNEDRTDFWKKDENGYFGRLYPEAPRRRQDRSPLYVENSAYYITDIKALRSTKSILGNRVDGFVISKDEALDINEPIDIIVAEAIIKTQMEENNG